MIAQLFFGYRDRQDFWQSLARPKLVMSLAKLWAVGAAIITFMEATCGLPRHMLASFFLLNVLELVSGVWASLHEGQTFDSRKFGRAIFKTVVYFIILGILHQYKSFEGGQEWYVFSWAYWSILLCISILLIRSIFENLHRLEVKEAQTIYLILDNKWTRILAIIVSPPTVEKSRRP